MSSAYGIIRLKANRAPTGARRYHFALYNLSTGEVVDSVLSRCHVTPSALADKRDQLNMTNAKPLSKGTRR